VKPPKVLTFCFAKQNATAITWSNAQQTVLDFASLFLHTQYRKSYFTLQASRDYISVLSATLRGISLF